MNSCPDCSRSFHGFVMVPSLQVQLRLEIDSTSQLDQGTIQPANCSVTRGQPSMHHKLLLLSAIYKSQALVSIILYLLSAPVCVALSYLRILASPVRSASGALSAEGAGTTGPTSCSGAGILCTSGNTHYPWLARRRSRVCKGFGALRHEFTSKRDEQDS